MSGNLAELFLRGGWVMWPLLAFSVLTWAIVLERTFVYLRLRPRLTELCRGLLHAVKQNDYSGAKQLCQSEAPYLADVFASTVDPAHKRELAERTADRNRVRLAAYLKKNLWVLGTIGTSSPFVGLLGTVVGIIRAFQDMAEKGAGGFSVVAGGISEALIATGAGLIVAIIALLTYNIFTTAANQTMAGVKLSLEEILDTTFSSQIKVG